MEDEQPKPWKLSVLRVLGGPTLQSVDDDEAVGHDDVIVFERAFFVHQKADCVGNAEEHGQTENCASLI